MSLVLLKVLARRRDRVYRWAAKRLVEIGAMEADAIISRRDAANLRRSIKGLATRSQRQIDDIFTKFGKTF
jgi:hypothetical protein